MKKTTPERFEITFEQALIADDLSQLGPNGRLAYVTDLCKSLELNPLTKPFVFATFDGKTQLYATKDCAEQLRKRDAISVRITERKSDGDVYYVIASAEQWDNGKIIKQDESIGAVGIDGLKGQAKADAMMHAETKAKRRVTLSICGVGIGYVDDLPQAKTENLDNKIPDKREISELQSMKEILSYYEKQASEADVADRKADTEKFYALAKEQRARIAEVEGGKSTKDVRASASAPPVRPKVEKASALQPETATPWQDVVCHLGTAAGPFGKKIGDLMGESVSSDKAKRWLKVLRDKLLAIKTKTATDKVLEAAVNEAAKTLEARPTVQEEKPKHGAIIGPSPDGLHKDEARMQRETETLNWRDVTAPPSIKKIAGKRLGNLAENYFPAIKDLFDKGKCDDMKLKAAVALAMEECGFGDDARALKTLVQKVKDLVVGESWFVAKMKEVEYVSADTGELAELSDLQAWEIRDLLRLWPSIEEYCREQLRIQEAKRTGGKA